MEINRKIIKVDDLSPEFNILYDRYKRSKEKPIEPSNKTLELLFETRNYKSSSQNENSISIMKSFNNEVFKALLLKNLDGIYIGDSKDITTFELREYIEHKDQLEKIRLVSTNPIFLNETEKMQLEKLKKEINLNIFRKSKNYIEENDDIRVDLITKQFEKEIINRKELNNKRRKSSIIKETDKFSSSKDKKTKLPIVSNRRSSIQKPILNVFNEFQEIQSNITKFDKQVSKSIMVNNNFDAKKLKKSFFIEIPSY